MKMKQYTIIIHTHCMQHFYLEPLFITVVPEKASTLSTAVSSLWFWPKVEIYALRVVATITARAPAMLLGTKQCRVTPELQQL